MVSALLQEMGFRRGEMGGSEIDAIYFGGGTPSVLETSEIESLIEGVYRNFTMAAEPEITLEANPDDLDRQTIKDLAGTAINRLSIGIQSFHETDLQLMNRAHTATEARSCLEEASQFFENLSADLIYGIPGQTDAGWERNVETLLSYNIPHISSYALTVENNTALKRFIEKGKVADVDEEAAARQFYRLIDLVEAAGFVHYELSNFGKPGYFSRNNTAYWSGEKYLGIGPSAHSYDGKRRSWNIRSNPRYLKAIADAGLPTEMEVLSTKDRYNEKVMTGLRTMWGVSLEGLSDDFGQEYAEYLLNESRKFVDQGLLSLDDDILKATKKGKFLTDGIASELFML